MLQKVKLFLSQAKKRIALKTRFKQSEEKTRICKLCFEEMNDSFFNILHKNPTICQKCYEKFNPVLKHFYIGKIRCDYLFNYDEVVRERLYQFKGCFDIVLANMFLERFNTYLKIKYRGYIIIPASSSKEADDKRGFNHVVQIFSILKKPMYCCIHKTKNVKQADLTSEERKEIKNYLKIDDIDLSKKKILIVDDVYTTGATVGGMIELIKSKNAKKIRVLTMSKTLDFDQRETPIQ